MNRAPKRSDSPIISHHVPKSHSPHPCEWTKPIERVAVQFTLWGSGVVITRAHPSPVGRRSARSHAERLIDPLATRPARCVQSPRRWLVIDDASCPFINKVIHRPFFTRASISRKNFYNFLVSGSGRAGSDASEILDCFGWTLIFADALLSWN